MPADQAAFRKQPRQERARQTVAAILEAAEDVLAERGYAGATTNRIARRAGVSIGSLYQYFPHKDALFGELLRRHQQTGQAIIDELREALSDADGAIEPILRRFFERMAGLHGHRPRLGRALLEQMPCSAERERRHQDETRRYVGEMVQALRARPGIAVRHPEAAAHIVIQTLASLTRWLGHEAPAELDRAAAIDEAVAMLTRYLHGEPAVV